MKRRTLVKGLATGLSSLYLSKLYGSSLLHGYSKAPITSGPFKRDWDSLAQYQVPDWFRDAKFGIWAQKFLRIKFQSPIFYLCTCKYTFALYPRFLQLE